MKKNADPQPSSRTGCPPAGRSWPPTIVRNAWSTTVVLPPDHYEHDQDRPLRIKLIARNQIALIETTEIPQLRPAELPQRLRCISSWTGLELINDRIYEQGPTTPAPCASSCISRGSCQPRIKLNLSHILSIPVFLRKASDRRRQGEKGLAW